jgi:DNA-binding transcriptional LysR family regulator
LRVSISCAARVAETGTRVADSGTWRESGAARSVELTDAGRRLAVHAEIILAQAEAAEADLSAQEARPSGRICVTAFPTAAAAFAPALVRSLRRHPGLTLLLQQAAPGEGLRRVRSGEADVALVDDWSGGLPGLAPGMLRCYPVVRDPVVLIVPRHHELADTMVPVDMRRLRETSRWMARPRASRSARPWTGCSIRQAAPPPCPGSSRAWGPLSAWWPVASASRSCPGLPWPPARAASWSGNCLAPP